MEESAALRNFRDFLSIYNQMAEICFNRCVNSLNERTLTPYEESCVEKCAGKHININHKVMAVYVEVQPQIANKRAQEMEATLASQQANIEQIPNNTNSNDQHAQQVSEQLPPVQDTSVSSTK